MVDSGNLSAAGVALAAGSALGGAFCGAVVGQLLAARSSRRQALLARAHVLIDEFYSPPFISHRGVVYDIPLAFPPRDDPSFDEAWDRVALGFADPALYERDEVSDYWQGETVDDGLNEHRHLAIYIGFVVRLAQLLEDAKRDRQVDAGLVALRIEGIRYDSDTLTHFADALDRLAVKKGSKDDGRRTAHIRLVVDWVEVDPPSLSPRRRLRAALKSDCVRTGA